MSDALTVLAGDLERYLKAKIRFYFAVGWIKEPGIDVLVVYYDQREKLPKGAVPATWRGKTVRTQPSLPMGTAPPGEENGFAWMVM